MKAKSLVINVQIVVERLPGQENDYQYALGAVEDINNILQQNDSYYSAQILDGFTQDDVDIVK
ncbi:MAG: hypothetical protein WCP55_03070 [Lentisphaerota bacterium]